MTQLTALHSLPEQFAVQLSDNMIISLEGEQADSYLHGQLTVNITALSDGIARHYAHCDNKGKTWSLGVVARHDKQLLMITNTSSGAHSLAQLNKYGVFSKVDIIDATPSYESFFVSSNVAEALLKTHFPHADFAALTSIPSSQKNLASYSAESGILYNSGLQENGVIAIVKSDVASALREQLVSLDITCFPHSVFSALQIKNVHATIDEASIAEYVPQMMNVHALEGIDFDKGCYMGQEVVARTRFLGKNKRAAYSLTLDGPVDIAPGASLEKQLGENWRIAGKVINSVALGQETWLLAVLNNDTTPSDLHRWADNTAVTCYPNALPYNIEQQASNIVKKRR